MQSGYDEGDLITRRLPTDRGGSLSAQTQAGGKLRPILFSRTRRMAGYHHQCYSMYGSAGSLEALCLK